MTDTIIQGRAAWGRIKDRERATWDDWRAVGGALIIGRQRAMQTAQTNRPVGTAYNRAMGHWLDSNGFDLTAQERHKLVEIMTNLQAVEQWRSTLNEAQRRRCNSPSAVWSGWRRAIGQMKPAPKRESVPPAPVHVVPKPKYPPRRVHFPQHMIRAAATAMYERRSMDYVILARVALEAAIPDELVLAELLPAPKSAPIKKPAAEEALAAA